MSREVTRKELFDVKTSLHFNLEILTENNDKGDQGEAGESEQNDKRPAVFLMIKMQYD